MIYFFITKQENSLKDSIQVNKNYIETYSSLFTNPDFSIIKKIDIFYKNNRKNVNTTIIKPNITKAT